MKKMLFLLMLTFSITAFAQATSFEQDQDVKPTIEMTVDVGTITPDVMPTLSVDVASPTVPTQTITDITCIATKIEVVTLTPIIARFPPKRHKTRPTQGVTNTNKNFTAGAIKYKIKRYWC